MKQATLNIGRTILAWLSTKNPYASNAKWIKKKVSAKSSSYTIRGLKAYSTFGVYVIPVVKVRGKTYRGQACEYIRCSYYNR